MISQFVNYLRYEQNRSELTVQRYARSLRDFEAYFKSRDEAIEWETVDGDMIRSWMEKLVDEGHKETSVNADLTALKSFFRFALSRKLVEKDWAHAVRGPKKQKPLPQYVREKEMDELLDRQLWSDNYKDVRARTILLLLYETGIRRSELTGLDDQDVDFATRQLKVTGKRDKQRIVPFGEELAEALQHYVELRNREVERLDGKALFLGNKGLRLTGSQLYAEVKRCLSLVTTMQKRSPHVLRHSFATAMLNHDAGLESVRMLLGHESLKTTEIYTHTTFEQLKRTYKEAHPRAEKPL